MVDLFASVRKISSASIISIQAKLACIDIMDADKIILTEANKSTEN